MKLALLVHLPEHVERFEPVARLLSGAELLLGTGRWAPSARDSRALTRQTLRRRGWKAMEHPQPGFDLILTNACSAPAAVTRWLAPGGRVVVWHESWCRSRFLHALPTTSSDESDPTTWILDPVVARLCADWPDAIEGLTCDRSRVTGDPRWDALAEPGAASRARHALGLQGDRPVTLVLADSFLMRPPWAAAIAALRGESDVVLRITTPGWLEQTEAWPRAWTGPGLRLSEPDDPLGMAALLALADRVVAPIGVLAHAAVMAGKRTVLVAEGEGALREAVAGRRTPDGVLADRPCCVAPSELQARLQEVVAMPAPVRDASLDGRGAARLAAVIAELRERPNAPAPALRS